MKAPTYIEHGKFALTEKPKPVLLDPRDAIVRVTLGNICASDLHIKHGSVSRAAPGITVGHDRVGVAALYDEPQTLPLPEMYGKFTEAAQYIQYSTANSVLSILSFSNILIFFLWNIPS